MAVRKLKKVEPQTKRSLNKDGWFNVITGLGTPKDKRIYSEVAWQPTTRHRAEAIYASDEMGHKIATIIPLDGTREGVTWNMDKNANHEEVVKFIESQFRRLMIWQKLAWAWTQARVYGGSVIFVNVDDGGRPLSTPLNPARVRSIRSLVVMDRWDFNVVSTDIISDLSSPDYGTPEFYNYSTSNGFSESAEYIPIHHSRMIRFDGPRLPTRLFKVNNYWHDSIYGYLYNSIRAYATNHDNISTIISDFNQPVYRIEGLSEAIAQDQDELIVKKLTTVDLMRSSARAIVLDKEDEFENVSTNVAGGRDLIDLTVQRLVAGSDIPHTRLLGNSPTGLGATGQSELINYYDSIASMQETELRRPIEILTDLIFNQRDNKMTMPEDLDFEFNPLFQDDNETEQKSREKQALIDEKYVTLGVYTPQECANSRFGTGRYSYETVLDPSVDRLAEVPGEPVLGGNEPENGNNSQGNQENMDDLDGL